MNTIMKTTAVIGGGASGIIAALTAAENKDRHVVLFERQARIGRKLLATGNGRCNLTNTGATVKNYHGGDPGFTAPALARFSPEQTLDYFKNLGLVSVEQYGGRVYPLSDSAASVLDVLRFALDGAGVETRAGTRIERVEKKKDKFRLYSDSGTEVFTVDSLIIACGGKAGGKLGGVPDGYEILRSFGHSCTKLYPALVPLRTDTDYPRSLKGIRADGAVSLRKRGKTPADNVREAFAESSGEILAQSCGEIQFTEKGISGPAVFDISRAASVSGGEVTINFLRNMSPEEVISMLRARRASSPGLENSNIFAGILHSRLGIVLVKYAGLRPSGLIGNLSDSNIHRLAKSAMNFSMNITGTDSFEGAQVTAGGISVSEFDPGTMESRLVPGLFACGEVLDVDGDCGGYNLQWAWSSGRLAGRLGAGNPGTMNLSTVNPSMANPVIVKSGAVNPGMVNPSAVNPYAGRLEK